MSKEEAREYFNTAQIELPENYYANAFRPLASINTMAALYNSKLSELIPYYLRRRTDELTKAWEPTKESTSISTKQANSIRPSKSSPR